MLISLINKIYTYYKSSNNIIITIITSFVNEINSSIGIVVKTTNVREQIKLNVRSDDLYDILDNESNNTLPIDKKFLTNDLLPLNLSTE